GGARARVLTTVRGVLVAVDPAVGAGQTTPSVEARRVLVPRGVGGTRGAGVAAVVGVVGEDARVATLVEAGRAGEDTLLVDAARGRRGALASVPAGSAVVDRRRDVDARAGPGAGRRPLGACGDAAVGSAVARRAVRGVRAALLLTASTRRGGAERRL